MIKICFVITSLSVGGAETMLLRLLENIDRAKFSPHVISLTSKGVIAEKIELLGIPVEVIGMRPGALSISSILTLYKVLKSVRPDVMHTWMYHSDLIGGVVGRLAGIRNIIWGIHHSNLDRDKNKKSTLMIVKLCAKLSWVLPKKIISCANRSKLVHVHNGYLEDKIIVIQNGFDFNKYHPEASDVDYLRREFSLSHETLLVGHIARFDSQKNHIGFLECASYIAKSIPNAVFFMVGEGVDSANKILREEIDRYCLQGRIYLLGRRADIPEILSGIDLLISSSHGEAFPIVVGEAMASGVPCVVTDVGDSAELVGDTGAVVIAGDMSSLAENAIKILTKDSAIRRSLGDKARKRIVENYGIDSITRRHEALYGQVFGNCKLLG